MRYLKEDELNLAIRFLFLSMAITVLEMDLHHMEKGAFKIKEPYLELIEKLITKAKIERRELRKDMYHKKIKVSRLSQNESFSSYLFVAGHREEKRNYFNPAIRKHVEAIIRELISGEDSSRQTALVNLQGAYQASNENEPFAAPDS